MPIHRATCEIGFDQGRLLAPGDSRVTQRGGANASSALVAALLERDTAVMKKIPPGTRRVTSALTLAEAGEPSFERA